MQLDTGKVYQFTGDVLGVGPFSTRISGGGGPVLDEGFQLDLFDKAATCKKAWDRVLSGLVLDALEAKAAGHAEPQEVEHLLQQSASAAWSARAMSAVSPRRK